MLGLAQTVDATKKQLCNETHTEEVTMALEATEIAAYCKSHDTWSKALLQQVVGPSKLCVFL